MTSDDERISEANRALAERMHSAMQQVWRVMRRYTEACARDELNLHMLSPNQLQMLFIVLHKGGISQKTLARLLRITPASVSTALRELEEKGYVERKPHADDARQMQVFASEGGRELMAKVEAYNVAAALHVIQGVPQTTVVQIVEGLEQLLAAQPATLTDDLD